MSVRLRIFGSVFIAVAVGYAFILTLLVAAAQQDAMAQIARRGLAANYSTGLVQSREHKELQAEEQTLAREARRLPTQSSDAEAELRLAHSEFERTWESVRSPIERLGRANLCPTERPQSPLEQWRWFIDCFDQLPPEQRRSYQAAAAVTPNPVDRDAARTRTTMTVQNLMNETVRVNNQRKALQEALQASRGLTEAFLVVHTLENSKLPGVRLLSPFPPVLLQILLALTSGAFGALLLTLILVVYPNNGFSFEAGANFGLRVLLGGLTAVSVYIVMSGGAGVLGAAPGFAEGTTNVMTFAAVGVLAGMFSDRVASWLSDRASVLLGSERQPSRASPAREGDPLAPGET